MKKILPLVGLLLTLGLAYLLQFFLTPKLFYPYNTLETGGVQIHMLHRGQRDAGQCSSMLSTLSTAVQGTCAQCVIKSACLSTLSKDQKAWLGSTPLQFPSLKSPGMVTVYQSNDHNLALEYCHESERQIRRTQQGILIGCSAPGNLRPGLEQSSLDASGGKDPYALLVWANLGIFTGLAGIVLASYLLRRQVAGHGSYSGQQPFKHWASNLSPAVGSVQKLVLAGMDVLVILLAFTISSAPDVPGIGGSIRSKTHALYMHAALIGLTVFWFWVGLEHYSRRRTLFDEIREIFRVVLGAAILAIAFFFVTDSDTSRVTPIVTWSLGFLLIPLGRSLSRTLLDQLGLWQLPAVIIGSGENANDAYEAVRHEHSLGYDIQAFIAPDAAAQPDVALDDRVNPIPVVRAGRDICAAIDGLGLVRVIIALDSLTAPGNQALVQTIALRYKNVHIIPALRGLPLFGTEMSHFFKHEVLFLTLRNNLARRSYQWIKRGFDLAGAIALIVMLAPVFAVLAWLIRRNGGAALYGHMRIGRNGKPFKCLKFRSMRPDADKVLAELLANDPQAKAEWDKDFKLRNDPRITPVGHFLRRTSLDELPQLFNVLKGEMSLVGPRPVVTQELERYGENVQYYLEVRPGMTGLWQVSGRNDTTYAQRVSLDSWYVQNWSLWYDIAILFKTIDIVFNNEGAY